MGYPHIHILFYKIYLLPSCPKTFLFFSYALIGENIHPSNPKNQGMRVTENISQPT